jgi:hypothetical protein
MTQGAGWEVMLVMEGRRCWSMVGRLGDGQTFEWSYGIWDIVSYMPNAAGELHWTYS